MPWQASGSLSGARGTDTSRLKRPQALDDAVRTGHGHQLRPHMLRAEEIA